MSIEVRVAEVGDVEALVALRMANAAAHVALDPEVYRVPHPAAVAGYFGTAVVSPGLGVLVAVAGGRVVGMVEVVPGGGAPEHQILRPAAVAQIHTVVLPEERAGGVGAALVAAAEVWARERGITALIAGIQHANAGAVRFYTRHGYEPSGISLVRRLEQ
jgi:GNAT superfamily N-acetyltransferase